MNCTECGRTAVSVGPFWICEVHGQLGVSRNSVVASVAMRPMLDDVAASFPLSIALACKTAGESHSSIQALQNLLFAYTATLQFSTLVLLSAFLAGSHQDPVAARAVRSLGRPHLDDWFRSLTALGRHMSDVSATAGRYPSALEPLIVAARGLPMLRCGVANVHEAVLGLRNREFAHGNLLTEERGAQLVEQAAPPIAAALDHFRCIRELTPVRRVKADGMIRLVGAEDSYPVIPIGRPELSACFRQSDIALTAGDGLAMPLFPLFIGWEDVTDGVGEDLLMFSGERSGNLCYLGARRQALRKENIDRFRELLARKSIVPEFDLTDLDWGHVGRWTREASLGAIDHLRASGQYCPELYQPRESDAQRSERMFDDDSLMRWIERGTDTALIIAAGPGSGKTSLLCRAVERIYPLSPDGRGSSRSGRQRSFGDDGRRLDCAVVFVRAIDLRGRRRCLLGRVLESFGVHRTAESDARHDLLRLFRSWGTSRLDPDATCPGLLIIVDGIDEAEDPAGVVNDLDALAGAAFDENSRLDRVGVRVVASIRHDRLAVMVERTREQRDTRLLANAAAFGLGGGDADPREPWVSLRPFTDDEVRDAYVRYQQHVERAYRGTWEELSSTTRDLLRHPLMLRLFHEALADDEPSASTQVLESNAKVIESTLWEVWLTRALGGSSSQFPLRRYAVELAGACMREGMATVPRETVDGLRARWERSVGADPARMAAELDPAERLRVAGVLTRSRGGDYEWASESVAAQAYWLALREGADIPQRADVVRWLTFPQSRHLDAALVLAGCSFWDAEHLSALAPLAACGNERYEGQGYDRGEALLGEVFRRVVPRKGDENLLLRLAEYGRRLSELAAAVGDQDRSAIATLTHAATFQVNTGVPVSEVVVKPFSVLSAILRGRRQ